MVIYEDIETFNDHINDLSCNYKLLCDSLRKLGSRNEKNSFLKKGEEYLINGYNRLERIKGLYHDLKRQFKQIGENYVNEVTMIKEEDRNDLEGLKHDLEDMEKELLNKSEELKEKASDQVNEPSFCYRDGSRSKLNVELVMRYPGSYVYREYMSNRRTGEGDVYIDCDGVRDELIVKYMRNDESLATNLKNMTFEEKNQLIDDLSFFEVPVKKDMIKQIECNDDSKVMEAWRERRVIVNEKDDNDFNRMLKEHKCFNAPFENELLKNIQYYDQTNSFYINLKLKYYDVIEDYLKNGKINRELLKKYEHGGSDNELIDEMTRIGIELSEEEKSDIKECFNVSLFIDISKIIDNMMDDKVLQKWVGNYKWKLIYRASEHRFTPMSFHEYCNDKGPTLLVIKSRRGYIFGGYTTQSWSGWGIYYYMI